MGFEPTVPLRIQLLSREPDSTTLAPLPVVHARSGGCGEGGIRTPGAPWLNGFQDRLLRPLGHLSEAQHAIECQNICSHTSAVNSPYLTSSPRCAPPAARRPHGPLTRPRPDVPPAIRARCIPGNVACAAAGASRCKLRHPHVLRPYPQPVLDRLQGGSQIAILLQNLRSFRSAGGRAGSGAVGQARSVVDMEALIECRG